MKVYILLLTVSLILSCKRDKDPFLSSKNQMIFIEGGEFNMGDEFDSLNFLAQPVQKILVNSFQISRYEISVKEFMYFIEDTKYQTEAEKEGWAYTYLYINDSIRKWEKKNINWKDPGFKQNENHPVTCISWNDASEYCKWLSEKTGTTYRLPFEKEWEYISRNRGESIKYPWGNNLPDGKTANYADINTPYPWANKLIDDKHSFTSQCGTYLPNDFGVYDLAGNVWEWCENTISTYENDSIWKYENAKVMRGGSFHNKGNTMRNAWRNYDYPNNRYFNLGFRIVNEIKR